jgi:hypothetical protein
LAQRNYPLDYLAIDRSRFSAEELVTRFYIYVTEAGGDFEHFRPLLRRTLRSVSPDRFVRTGQINLNTSVGLNLALRHWPYVASSPWVRERFERAILDPRNRGAIHINALIRALSKGGVGVPAQSVDVDLRKYAQQLIGQILAQQESKSCSNLLQSETTEP